MVISSCICWGLSDSKTNEYFSILFSILWDVLIIFIQIITNSFEWKERDKPLRYPPTCLWCIEYILFPLQRTTTFVSPTQMECSGYENKLHLMPRLLIWRFGKCEVPALADGFPLKSERQQVSSSPQDSTQYSSRLQQSCSLDGLHSSCYFQVFQSLYQSFGDCTVRNSYNWYHCHLHVP